MHFLHSYAFYGNDEFPFTKQIFHVIMTLEN